MNEFESDWISLSQSQSGVRVFLCESQRTQQGVWIQDDSVWIKHGRIQDGCHHQVELERMSEIFFVEMVGTNLGKCESLSQSNMRWNTKMAESNMAKFKMAEIKMTVIIKLGENEWVWVRLN